MPVIFIIGPTAIGKTRLSIKLARRINGEVISADSMQVYKGMTVLSQAPTVAQRRLIKHHMVGILSPTKEYNVASFRCRAKRIIKSIIRKGRTPIIVGGSGLYIKGLLDGLFSSPNADMKFRMKMERFVSRRSSVVLHGKLAEIDPQSAKAIHPNDKRRIIRALELYHSTGKTMTELKSNTHGIADLYNVKIFGLKKPKPQLYKDIDARVEGMFRSGVFGEVRRLAKRRLSKTACVVLGLKELSGYIDGEYELGTAKELLSRNTRHFAKRQMTWFRSDRRIRWFDVSKLGMDEIVRRMVKVINGKSTVSHG